jgi:hypothetical protein
MSGPAFALIADEMTWRRLLAQSRDRGRSPGLRRLDVDRRDRPDVSGRFAGVPARPVAAPLDAGTLARHHFEFETRRRLRRDGQSLTLRPCRADFKGS